METPWLLFPTLDLSSALRCDFHTGPILKDLVGTPCLEPCWGVACTCLSSVTLAAPPTHTAFLASSSSRARSAPHPSGLVTPPPTTPLPTPHPQLQSMSPKSALLKRMPSSGQHISTWMVLASPSGSSSPCIQLVSKEIPCVFPQCLLQTGSHVPCVSDGLHHQLIQNTGLTSLSHTLCVRSISSTPCGILLLFSIPKVPGLGHQPPQWSPCLQPCPTTIHSPFISSRASF